MANYIIMYAYTRNAYRCVLCYVSVPTPDLGLDPCERWSGNYETGDMNSSFVGQVISMNYSATGAIKSPYYPYGYPSKTYCTWTFIQFEGQTLQLSFGDFAVQPK